VTNGQHGCGTSIWDELAVGSGPPAFVDAPDPRRPCFGPPAPREL